MRTINLQTVYQLVITALLLGACLGLLGQRLPWLGGNPVAALEQNTFSVAQILPLAEMRPRTTVAPSLPTTVSPPQYEFVLTEQIQFEERISPRIFLYVYEDDEGLAGYTLRIRKDGSELPIPQRSVAGLPSYTWPIPNERQRSTNLKVEFPDVNPTGVWEVQLIDATGSAVGPVATFRLQPNDANQEMYVLYRKR